MERLLLPTTTALCEVSELQGRSLLVEANGWCDRVLVLPAVLVVPVGLVVLVVSIELLVLVVPVVLVVLVVGLFAIFSLH